MTTYNAAAVADAIIAYGKGITLQQGRALRDNPIAIAEGASGAPKVMAAALNIATGSASASISSGSAMTFAIDTLSFFPVVAGIASITSSGGFPAVYMANTTGSTQTASLTWSYIA